MIGQARMEMKVGLTFACMNLKKLAMMKQRLGYYRDELFSYLLNVLLFFQGKRKMALGYES